MFGERGRWSLQFKIVVATIFLIIIGYIIWSNFYYYPECDTRDCFNSALERCNRASFITGDKMIFEYNIVGLREYNGMSKCKVEVILLQGDLNQQESLRLEGKKMDCYLEKGLMVSPESSIDKCHGLLKEGLQEIIIDKLHTYIAKNLGRINLEAIDFKSSDLG